MRDPDPIDSSDDIIDTRDVAARIRFLECERERFIDASDDDAAAEKEWNEGEEGEELKKLMELDEQIHDESGVALINESYWPEYVQQFAEDMHGAAVRDAAWPFSHIDWDAAADSLRMDYSTIDWDGNSFYYRQ